MVAATRRRRAEKLAAERPEEVKLQKDRKAFLRKAAREAQLANIETAGDCRAREARSGARYRASQKALAAQDPRLAESQRANKAAKNKRYLAKKANQFIVTDSAGSCTQSFYYVCEVISDGPYSSATTRFS